MFKVSKSEAEYIRAHAKNSRITVIGKNKKARAKTRFVDETRETYRLLDEYRALHSMK